jgi:hypothetical protein
MRDSAIGLHLADGSDNALRRVVRGARHLTFRMTTIGAVCVRLDELSDGETIRGFLGGDGAPLFHLIELVYLRRRGVERPSPARLRRNLQRHHGGEGEDAA